MWHKLLETVFQGFREVPKQRAHLFRALEETFPILVQECAGLVDDGTVPDGGEHIEKTFVVLSGIARPVGRQQRQTGGPGEIHENSIALFLRFEVVALDLDRQPPGEDAREALQEATAGLGPSPLESMGERPLRSTGQAIEASSVLDEQIPANGRLALGAAECPGCE